MIVNNTESIIKKISFTNTNKIKIGYTTINIMLSY